MFEKEKNRFIFCVITIAVISAVLPEIVRFFMDFGKGNFIFTTDYYIRYILFLVSAHLSLLYLFLASLIIFLQSKKK
ncbi:hypothetical protein CIL05_16460 [Virgibacillus profundi]|uniref:Uncharacterized protein n=1 Tax=Virgibacillus profundi TaxID=2024555 RepID=A0A2A2IB30_9BACI|nr:hypothetical protein CIL05_16460 [Virgibacillus profundi]PXY52699.1 hypothetical protein CIT14_16605 [Virgibacillus profundi]